MTWLGNLWSGQGVAITTDGPGGGGITAAPAAGSAPAGITASPAAGAEAGIEIEPG